MTTAQPTPSARKPRALLIEERGSAALVASRLLGRLGYEVELVTEPGGVTPELAQTRVDLVLVDLKAEGLVDLRTIATLRADGAAQAVIIALGTPSNAPELRTWKGAGIDGQLDRPLDLERLRREVAQCQTRRSSQPSALDASALLEEVGGDRALLRHLSELFDEQAAARMRELTEAVARGDAEGIDHAAHALKSMIGVWQRGPSYELAASLERMGRERDLESAGREHHRFSDALSELQGHIHELLRAGEHA